MQFVLLFISYNYSSLWGAARLAKQSYKHAKYCGVRSLRICQRKQRYTYMRGARQQSIIEEEHWTQIRLGMMLLSCQSRVLEYFYKHKNIYCNTSCVSALVTVYLNHALHCNKLYKHCNTIVLNGAWWCYLMIEKTCSTLPTNLSYCLCTKH